MRINVEVRKNLYTYLFLLLFTVAGIVYGNSLGDTHTNLRVWDIANLLIMLIGVPFVFLQTVAKLPNFWQKDISSVNRFLKPFFIGLVFGVLDVLVFKMILHPEPYLELPPFLQPFPYSIFLYVSGSFEVEVFYLLVPLTIVMLLGANFKKGQYLNYFFWTAAFLTSLREPLEQLGAATLPIVIYALVTGFTMNLLQAVYFRNSGFLASLTLRLGHYLLWHIILGVYVEYFEVV